MNKLMRGFSNKKGGYTLLFSVLTATLVLGVAVFIVDLSRKQHELAVSARNSIYSFYAADSGIECAVSASNWTNSGGLASTTSGTLKCGTGTLTSALTLEQVGPLQISPTLIIYGNSPKNLVRQQTGFVSLSFNNGTTLTNACAQLIITTGSLSSSSIQPVRIIDARGYNLCSAGPVPNTTNTGTVERALRLIQTGVW